MHAAVLLALALHAIASQARVLSAGTHDSSVKSRSTNVQGASVSYKQANGICETTPNVNAYSGYVHLSSKSLAPFEDPAALYDLNMHFFYVRARNDAANAPLAIWLSGGPGLSGLEGATSENGPCYVSKDANSTYLNQWSFNNHVNMLYVDTPNFSGYTYQSLVNGSLDLVSGSIVAGAQVTNQSTLPGVFPVQNPQQSANNSDTNAKIMWQFMQGWLDGFPEHKTSNDRISVWSNSYGGYIAPAIMSHFLNQNKKVQAGKLGKAKVLNLDTLGLTNSCIDGDVQYLSWPEVAYNNTYGLQMIPKTVYNDAVNNYKKPGGCKDLIAECRDMGKKLDPKFTGNNAQVNELCLGVVAQCLQVLYLPMLANRSPFDFANKLPDPSPPLYAAAFFNQEWVQEAMGVPLNFSIGSGLIANNFIFSSVDIVRQDMSHLQQILESNIKVALLHGDRDHRCNWVGGEAVSLAVPYSGSAKFRSSGYETIAVNSTYQGGVVRQYGKFSFSRVFESGHALGYYQPETTYQIFMRAMFNRDIATGLKAVGQGSSYQSQGPSSSWQIKNKLPKSPAPICQLYSVNTTCTENQAAALTAGKAIVKDFIVVSPRS